MDEKDRTQYTFRTDRNAEAFFSERYLVCPKCGAAAEPGMKFCMTCGSKLVPAAPAEEVVEEAEGDAIIASSEEGVLVVPEEEEVPAEEPAAEAAPVEETPAAPAE